MEHSHLRLFQCPQTTPFRQIVIFSRPLSEVVSHPVEQPFWYVLRITYQRELRVKEQLDKMGIQNFVPTRRVRRRTAQGQFCYVTEAALHNYVFVKTTRVVLRQLKTELILGLRYVMRDIDGRRLLLVVPEEQMQSFIAVAGNTEEHILFLSVDEIDLKKGEKVRILGGPFAGVVGTFMRITKKHEKRVVVQIEGLVAVATTALPASLVEKIV